MKDKAEDKGMDEDKHKDAGKDAGKGKSKGKDKGLLLLLSLLFAVCCVTCLLLVKGPTNQGRQRRCASGARANSSNRSVVSATALRVQDVLGPVLLAGTDLLEEPASVPVHPSNPSA